MTSTTDPTREAEATGGNGRVKGTVQHSNSPSSSLAIWKQGKEAPTPYSQSRLRATTVFGRNARASVGF